MGKATFVLMGGTGDLSKKKLIPSLYRLYKKDKFEDFDIVGTSRHDMTNDEYRDEVKEFVDDDSNWEDFSQHINFARLNFYEPDHYGEFVATVRDCCDHRIFYLATLPQHFEVITENLAEHDLVKDSSKVVYEKPFGDDLESAKKLNECIHKLFSEDQVYRVDHYLDKELVGNVSVLRFTNTVMQPIWCSDYIDQIQIMMSEDFGVEDRGEFYDKYGAIKDVFQNHLMQLLALTTMEDPDKFESEHIRDEKVEVINNVEVEDVITGQYEGYTEEEGVPEDSKMETFAAMKAFVNTERWKNVPIYMVSGKNLEKETAKIYVRFKNTACDLFDGICPVRPNSLVVSIKPDESIYLTINTKVPGEMTTTESKMEFCYSCQHGPNTPEAYENVFLEVMRGNQHSFVRNDEIEAEWKIIDNIDKPEPFKYKRGEFPGEAREFIRKDDRTWFDL